jgi:hypothetical protein
MSVIAAALRELMAAGLTGDALAAAAERIEAELAAATAAEQAGRSKHAQAQARYKAKKRVISADQNDQRVISVITGDQRDHQTEKAPITQILSDHQTGKSPHTPLDSTCLLPSLSSLPKERKIKKERKKAIECAPSDWTPNEKTVQFATDHGCTPEHIAFEAGRFRNYVIAHDKKYRDLNAAFRNWVTSPYQAAGLRARAPSGSPLPRPGSREDRAERTYRAQQELKAFANGDHADDAQPSGGAGRPDAGLLPFGKSARS